MRQAGTGEVAPWDGETAGELEARGPWVIREYYEDPCSAERFHEVVAGMCGIITFTVRIACVPSMARPRACPR